MQDLIRKTFTPWLSQNCFASQAQFSSWLARKTRQFSNLRMILIVLAVLPLLAGYVLDRHAIMLLTIVPLILVLLLSVALERIDSVLHGQNKDTSKRS